MANQRVIKVRHANLPTGEVTFVEEEVISMGVRHEDVRVEQLGQTGNLTVAYIPNVRYEFDIGWSVFYQNTLVKLHMIWNLRDKFILYPFLIESPLSWFEVVWGEGQPAREAWFRGRRQAQWELPITWKESKLESCVPVAAS